MYTTPVEISMRSTPVILEELIERFGNSIGLGDLQFDEFGCCHLTADEEIAIALQRRGDGTGMAVYTVLDQTIPEYPSKEWAAQFGMMTLSPLSDPQSPGLGYDAATDRLIAYFQLQPTQLEVDFLQNAILGLISWRKALATSPVII